MWKAAEFGAAVGGQLNCRVHSIARIQWVWHDLGRASKNGSSEGLGDFVEFGRFGGVDLGFSGKVQEM